MYCRNFRIGILYNGSVLDKINYEGELHTVCVPLVKDHHLTMDFPTIQEL